MHHALFNWASFVAQLGKNLPTMQESPVQFLGQEDPLEEEMATHSSIPAGKLHGQRSLAGGLQSTGVTKSRT